VVLAAASSRVLAAPSDAVPEPKLSVHSAIDQLGFKFVPQKTEDVPAVFSHPPPVIEMQASLPTFEVIAPRVKLKDNDVATDKLRVEQAVNKYTTPLYRTTFGPLSQIAEYAFNIPSIFHGWHPNEAEAMTLREQDIRIERMEEMKRLSRLNLIGNPDAAKADLESEREVYLDGRDTGR
jgi:hypothetical protein